MNMRADAGPVELAGQVKWFDPAKGFGFILDAAGGVDILLHGNVLRNFGQSSVVEGTRMRVLAVPTARGMQAVEVLEVEGPGHGGPAPIADLISRDAADLHALPFRPARVKWFDKGKGFGFANIFGEAGDVFLHLEVLRHAGFADLSVGEAVAIRVVEGRRGPMAAELAGWDRALEPAAGPEPAIADARRDPAELIDAGTNRP